MNGGAVLINSAKQTNPLVSYIKDRIAERPEAAVTFREYMEWCLYHASYGYYTSDKPKVGKSGDFYTSSAVGGIFGGLVARALSKLMGDEWKEGPVRIVEWGAGTGQLALQLLDELQARFPGIYERLTYVAVERSRYHAERLLSLLEPHRGHVQTMEPDQWLAEQVQTDGPGIAVISNELLDAFAVHRIRRRNGELYELHVGWDDEKDCFKEKELPCNNEDVLHYITEERIRLAEGQTAEVNLDASRWLERTAAAVGNGVLITIDYGDAAEELYSPHRMNGTFVCYRNHLALDDPYRFAGEQDMTAHVNFSALIRSGKQAGLADWKLMTQKQFLLEAGILELLMEHASTDPFGPEARRNRAVRQLLLSDQMSELFKVLIQRKAVD
ncbi:SAM-dependent methyltransferase [Paenibacillus contaminans]|uniref:SAM-dependent methyltransferase n=1 Tax=Paenibacillus contaminans TaxID=450362 RepID=A0A329MIY7_9BACL|nr:SAM-dependent methyltransferase [Paenibacillus contaminans]